MQVLNTVLITGVYKMNIKEGELLIKEFNLKGNSIRMAAINSINNLSRSFQYGNSPDVPLAVKIAKRWNLLDYLSYLIKGGTK